MLVVMLARGLESANRQIVEDKLDGRLHKREAAVAEKELLTRARRIGPVLIAATGALTGVTMWEALASDDWGGWTPFHLVFFGALLLVTLAGHAQVGSRLADARERVTRLTP